MIKIAVICRNHTLTQVKNSLARTGQYELCGFQITNQLGFNIIDSFELIQQADAVFIEGFQNVYLCMQHAVRNSKHIFMQKPRYLNPEESREILDLAREAGTFIQVGNMHRYHHLLQEAVNYSLKPRHLDIYHQIIPEQHELTDEMLQELVLNDVEITLKIIRSGVKKLSANAVRFGESRTGLINARIEFDNGSVATIAADLLNGLNRHETNLYQNDAHLAIDFINNSLKFNTFASDSSTGTIPAFKEYPAESEHDQLKKQLLLFGQSINTGRSPLVTFDDVYQAMLVFNQIQEKIKHGSE